MGWVVNMWDRGLIFKPYQTDKNMFIAVKTRQPFKCCNCQKQIPKGSWGYGSDWTRICLKCGEEFSEVGIEGCKMFIDMIRLHQESFKLNKDEWENTNTLAKL